MSAEQQSHHPVTAEDYSIWRHTALRYGGYADEVGEFLAPYFGGLGKFAGYFASGIYCLADLSTTMTQKFRNAPPELTTGQTARRTLAEGIDLSFFHVVATLLIPPRLIGAVVASVDRMLDRDALGHALREAALQSPARNPFQRMACWISAKKLGLEIAVNKRVSPFIERTLAQKQTENGRLLRSMEAGSSWLLNRHGPHLAPAVECSARLADTYNRWMPWSSLKDEELGKTLRDNVQFLRDPDVQLSPRQLTKLAWLKPFPVLAGIAMIPLVAHPFDKLMGKIQDWTTRPLLGKNRISREQGRWVSKRNPSFWGRTPHPPRRIATNTAALNSLHRHHRPFTHFGTVLPAPFAAGYPPASYSRPYAPLYPRPQARPPCYHPMGAVPYSSIHSISYPFPR